MNSIQSINPAWTYLYNSLWWLSLLRIQWTVYINFLIEFQVPQIISQVHPLGGPAQTYLMKISCLETSILLNVEAFFFLLLLRLLLLDLFCFSINLSILACESQLHTIFRVVVVRYVEKLPTWPDIVRIKGNKIWYPPEMMVSRPKIYLM